MKIFILHLAVVFYVALFGALGFCHGQDLGEVQPAPNWLVNYGYYYESNIYFRYDNYSKEHLGRLRNKLDVLQYEQFTKEWEGRYYPGFDDPVGYSALSLSFDKGFAQIHIYTCLPELRAFDFGTVIDNPDSIEFVSNFSNGDATRRKPLKYVKVKWGEDHYLVEEASLLSFSQKAVGIFMDRSENTPDNNKWMHFWTQGDRNRIDEELPQFPTNYKKFERQPIVTKTETVTRRLKKTTSGDETSSPETAVYTIRIKAGNAAGVRKGMTFLLPETRNRITITRVFRNSAIGEVTRYIDENKLDECWDDGSTKIPCAPIKPGMKVRTLIGIFDL